MTPINKVTVVYIAAWGRSGTTIMDQLLGQLSGFHSAGEVHYLWDRGYVQGRLCGCGEPVTKCSVWATVLHDLQAELPGFMPETARRLLASVKTRRSLALALQSVRRRDAPNDYIAVLEKLYRSLARQSNNAAVVDSSKFPGEALALLGSANLRVRIVHVTRDPRAVAFSWSRRKASPGKSREGGMMTRVGLLRSDLTWLYYNLILTLLARPLARGRYLHIRYEDFVADPHRSLESIADFAGIPADVSGVLGAGSVVEMRQTHTASGNPSRFRTGATPIRNDDEWTTQLPRWARAVTVALCGPLMAAYGYRIRVGQRT